MSTYKESILSYPEEVAPFVNALLSVFEMHMKKAKDYGSGENPYKNIEATEELGIPAWVGVTMRMGDKEVRIKSFLTKGSLANESVRDSIHDNAVYGILRLMEYDRAEGVEAVQAVCKDHMFDEFAVCKICGWSEPVSPSGGPHSRACGIHMHYHGIHCALDCPTCHGVGRPV